MDVVQGYHIDLSVSQGSTGEPGDRGDVGRKGSTGPQVMLESVDVIYIITPRAHAQRGVK